MKAHRRSYLAFLIKTTSDAAVPSEMTSLLSRDQSNENIASDFKVSHPLRFAAVNRLTPDVGNTVLTPI